MVTSCLAMALDVKTHTFTRAEKGQWRSSYGLVSNGGRVVPLFHLTYESESYPVRIHSVDFDERVVEEREIEDVIWEVLESSKIRSEVSSLKRYE